MDSDQNVKKKKKKKEKEEKQDKSNGESSSKTRDISCNPMRKIVFHWMVESRLKSPSIPAVNRVPDI